MRVICNLPNASDNISGVAFTKHGGQMVSEEISDEQAARFLGVSGFIEYVERKTQESGVPSAEAHAQEEPAGQTDPVITAPDSSSQDPDGSEDDEGGEEEVEDEDTGETDADKPAEPAAQEAASEKKPPMTKKKPTKKKR